MRAILADPAYAVWLLEHDGEAVGYALAGPAACRMRTSRPGTAN